MIKNAIKRTFIPAIVFNIILYPIGVIYTIHTKELETNFKEASLICGVLFPTIFILIWVMFLIIKLSVSVGEFKWLRLIKFSLLFSLSAAASVQVTFSVTVALVIGYLSLTANQTLDFFYSQLPRFLNASCFVLIFSFIVALSSLFIVSVCEKLTNRVICNS